MCELFEFLESTPDANTLDRVTAKENSDRAEFTPHRRKVVKLNILAMMAVTGAAAAAIAAAPAATAAVTDPAPAGATITQRDGHVHIDARPDEVSPPRSYGQFSSPTPFIFWD
jgi:hypothetical protein